MSRQPRINTSSPATRSHHKPKTRVVANVRISSHASPDQLKHPNVRYRRVVMVPSSLSRHPHDSGIVPSHERAPQVYQIIWNHTAIDGADDGGSVTRACYG